MVSPVPTVHGLSDYTIFCGICKRKLFKKDFMKMLSAKNLAWHLDAKLDKIMAHDPE
jgi:uncharacterized CHY-type Zn-finger protein